MTIVRVTPTLADLHVQEHGDNSASRVDVAPIVMVHGGWTDSTTWRFITPPLASDRLVVTYDRRGHSQSPWSAQVPRLPVS